MHRDILYCRHQVLGILGDDVLKHVACRVTVDGAAAEGSPVEASLITIDSLFEILEHARMRND